MVRIPVIVGFGGVNTAGRSSFHHGYRRTIIDTLGQQKANQTYQSLAALMNLELSGNELNDQDRQYILDNTLIRRMNTDLSEMRHIPLNKRLPMDFGDDQHASFITKARNLPDQLPANWTVTELGGGKVNVIMTGENELLLPSVREASVQSAGQLPTGFNPGSLYPSRSHPRGLEMTIYAASDALGSLGIDWPEVCSKVAPDQISVYAGSAMGQLDANGSGGMLGSRFNGKRVTSKQLPFGLAEMPADFINAYVLGSMGSTGTNVGACASFLYNLRQGICDIQEGRSRVVVVGNSEAPVVADIIDGYSAMGALATDEELLALDAAKNLSEANHRRACRPFSDNSGFTVAESAQYIVLFDDDLAMELGATVHGGVTDVFINADGHKKSISSPGVGNYLTVGKALAAARSILGEESVQQRSFIQAHGTSTPQNRVTESHILNEMAKVFGIAKWPVSAIKAYLGHSLAVSAGDQIVSSLGVWNEGIIPGIKTIEHVAEDVFQSNLLINSEHKDVGLQGMDSVIVNAKGFGGNNASGVVLAPHIIEKMLAKKHGANSMKSYQDKNVQVREKAQAYDSNTLKGNTAPIYKFDHGVLSGDDLSISSDEISVPGYEHKISLKTQSPYSKLL
jgi:acetoacetyl-[acyl-carrier protein] synthase